MRYGVLPYRKFFDLDGTLWDGVECYVQGFNDFFKIKNIEKQFTKDDLYGLMGLEEDKYLELTLPEFSKEERKLMYKEIIDLQYEHIKKNGGEIYHHVQMGLKILGSGELKKAVTVKAHLFSGSAKTKIEAKGGQAVLLEK